MYWFKPLFQDVLESPIFFTLVAALYNSVIQTAQICKEDYVIECLLHRLWNSQKIRWPDRHASILYTYMAKFL